jgi:hypothetical protein
LAEILGQSRRVEADLVAHIAEGEAYLRIAVARASREHPMLMGMT